MRFFSPKERTCAVREVLEQGRSLNKTCIKYGCSRQSLYLWIKRYQASSQKGLSVLNNRYKKGKLHPRAISQKLEKLILDIVVKDPKLGIEQISQKLRNLGFSISKYGIYCVLVRHNLQVRELREQFSLANQAGTVFAHKIPPAYRAKIVEEFLIDARPITEICRRWQISRTAFYEWLRRYKLAIQAADEKGENESNLVKALARQYKRGCQHHRCISEEVRKVILSIVRSNPDLSVHKVYAQIPKVEGQKIATHQAIQNLFVREGLNTAQARRRYVQEYLRTPEVQVAPLYQPEMPMYRLRQLIAPFVTIPKLLLTKPKEGIWYFAFGILPLVIFAFWFRLLLTAPSGTSQIGLIFASIALTFGLFFFLYSLKYYLTILMVLRLAQSGARGPTPINADEKQISADSNVNDQRSTVQNILRAIPLVGRVEKFLGSSRLGSNNNQSRINPLLVNLEKIELTDRPFVSIHVAIYNETKVIERLIRACTSQAWIVDSSQLTVNRESETVNREPRTDNHIANYELVIVDDSTDETTELAKQVLVSSMKYQVLRKERDQEKEIFVFIPDTRYQIPNTSLPTVKLIHRQERAGFKGGALQEALENTDPKAAYICVFDADFVPYPDTVEQFVKTFQVLAEGQPPINAESAPIGAARISADISENQRGSEIAAVQGYQWHVLNKSENWVTRGVRTEYAGSYVIERSGEEIYQGLKQIAGSVYCIRADVLRAFGWGTSITEDFELTLRLYEAGYKVAFTPYIQAPAEAVSTVRRLIRQRMRWAEGASFNVKVMLARMFRSTNLTPAEKLEFAYLAPYYLQAAFLVVGTLSWFISEAVLHTRLPFWTAAFGWSLVFTNLLSLPLMNVIGLFLEESDERDYIGILSFVALSYIVVPFQAYAAIKGFLEHSEGPWFRTPKTGAITDVIKRVSLFRFGFWPFGKPAPATVGISNLSNVSGQLSTVTNSAFNYFGNQLATAPVALPFKIRRRLPHLGKILIVILLTLAISINYFAFMTPTAFAFGNDRTFSENTTINTAEVGNAAGTSGNATLTTGSVRPTFDAASSANSGGGVTSLTWSHTTSGTDRILIVGVSLNRNASTITGVTYNSVAMTNIGTAGFGTAYMSLWQLVAPATGVHDIVVSLSGYAEVIGGATSWTGVHQTTPLGTFASATGTSTSPSVNVTSATGEVVVDTLNARGTATATVDPSQTERWNLLTTGAEPIRGTGSNESGAATVTMSWTLGASEGWAIGGVSIKPVFAAGDRVLIIQMTGTGAGNFEERQIKTIDSDTQVTLTANKTNTYTNDGSSKAQMIKAEINNSVTVNSGVTVTASAWDGTVGGVIYYIANTFTINSTGIVDMNGKGFSGGSQVSGGGGGAGGSNGGGSGGSGGTSGNAGTGPGAGGGGTAVNNPGGGGSAAAGAWCGGGGAGGSPGGGAGGSYKATSTSYAGSSGAGGAGGDPGLCTAGSAGTASAGSGGTVGSTYGNADSDFSGTTCNGGTGCLFLGSGGGSGGSGSGGGGGAAGASSTGGTGGDGGSGGAGSAGGGIIYISTNTFTNWGTIRANGLAGSNGGDGSVGGDGSGSSAAAGGGGGANGAGGAGGSGGSLWVSGAVSMSLQAGLGAAANATGGSAGSGSSTGGNGGVCTSGTGDGGGGGGYKAGTGGSGSGTTTCSAAGSDAAGTGSGAGAGGAGAVGRIKCDNNTGNPVEGCDNTEVATAPVPEYVIFGAPVVYFLPKLARRLKKLRILRRVIAMLSGQ